MKIGCIVFTNKLSSYYLDFDLFIRPYFDLWGVTFEIRDISEPYDINDLGCYSLTVFGHREIGLSLEAFKKICLALEENNSGLLNFDCEVLKYATTCIKSDKSKKSIFVANEKHYITRNHYKNEKFDLNRLNNQTRSLIIDEYSNSKFDVLLNADNSPLLLSTVTNIKIVHWVSYEWISHLILGPLLGLDDVLLRSVIWTSKKPFILKSIPNYATLRVDDCVGDSGHYKSNPFEWVSICNKYSFKPWLGIFFDSLSSLALKRLKEIGDENKASISIHGEELFGKYFKNDDAITQNEIKQKIFSFSEDNKIVLSSYVIPHAYDITKESLLALKELGINNVGIAYPPDSGGGVFEPDNKWILGEPFRLFEEGTDNVPWDGSMLHNPIYYNDFIKINNDEVIFNCLSEIRDVNGYEWFNYTQTLDQILNVENAIQIGTKIFTRCFQSKVLGNLFTHEDSWRGKFISLISVELWEQMIAGISSNILRYNPKFDFIENAIENVKQLKLSKIYSIDYDQAMSTFFLTKNADNLPNLQVYYEYDKDIIFEKNLEFKDNKDTKQLHFTFNPEWPTNESFFENEFPVKYLEDNFAHFGFLFSLHCDGYIGGFKTYTSCINNGFFEILLFNSDNMQLIYGPSTWIVDKSIIGWQSYLIEPFKIKKGNYFIFIKNFDGYIPYAPSGFCVSLNKCFMSATEKSSARFNKETNEIIMSNDNYLRDIIFIPNERISK